MSIDYPDGPCYPATLSMSAAEVEKLPQSRDIDILMTIRWTSSSTSIAEKI
jgi:hypothetical protein